ncbi:ABC transporter permease [Glycomyces paridis]|uniref:ABC transporter permease n=1 Tax=Glycomyces paridis TaxID=2126555 RepID=A0A4S8PQZ2_9ACTN|nr:ABC transporter permease [Glycomyces paridis]THV30694.1 ABC transporter permease [Glycomyces paridis]
MNRLVRAELRRLTSTPLWRWGPAAAVLSGGALTALCVLVGPERFDPPMPGVATEAGTRLVLSLIGMTVLVPALFGALAVTSEYRHRTIAHTFLFEPRRHRVLGAKLAAYTIAGAVYGLITAAAGAGALYGAAAAKGVAVGADPVTVAQVLAGLAAAQAVYAVIGVGLGALIQNQTATLLVLGAYLYMVEHALAIVPGFNLAYPLLPGGATAALTEASLMSEAAVEVTGAAAPLLPPLLGAAVLLAYALLASAAAVLAPMRRDVV